MPFISSLLSVNNSSSWPNLNLVTFLYSSSKGKYATESRHTHAYFSNHSTLLEKVCTKDLLSYFYVRKINSCDGCHEYSSWRPTRKTETILKYLKQRGFKVGNWLCWRQSWETQGAEGKATQRSGTARATAVPKLGGRERNQDFQSPGTRPPVTLTGRGLYWSHGGHTVNPGRKGRRPLASFCFAPPNSQGLPSASPEGSQPVQSHELWFAENSLWPISPSLFTAEPVLWQQRGSGLSSLLGVLQRKGRHFWQYPIKKTTCLGTESCLRGSLKVQTY